MNDDENTEGTITKNVKILRERLEETNGQLKVLEESRLKRKARMALERLYPSRWKHKP